MYLEIYNFSVTKKKKHRLCNYLQNLFFINQLFFSFEYLYRRYENKITLIRLSTTTFTATSAFRGSIPSRTVTH